MPLILIIIKMKKQEQDAATLLLNLKCRDTQKTIEANEIVKIHNWGMHTANQVIGYGHFSWDEHERKFDFTPHAGMNSQFGIEGTGTVEDNYDLFRTSPAKLNEGEQAALRSWD